MQIILDNNGDGVILQLKNGTASSVAAKNPVLKKGEALVELDTGLFKVGDGTTAYNSLSYFGCIVKASVNNGAVTVNGTDVVVYTLPTAAVNVLGGVKSQAAGTGKVVVGTDGTMSVSNVASADKLSTARTISLAGDATGSASFDGSAAKSITVALVSSGVTAGTYEKVTVDAKGRVTAGTTLAASDIPTITLSKVSDAGTAAAKNIGAAAGNVPVLDSNGKLLESVLPAIAVTDTFVKASETEMLALTAQTGDVCIRTDISATFILKASPASTLANWARLPVPTDLVQSVNGKTGVVVLSTDEISEGSSNLYYTQARFTTAFATAIAATNSTSLKDGSTIVHSTDTLVINCGTV